MSDQSVATILEPTEEQMKTLLDGEQKGPFHFVNLLKFKPLASYPSDHPLAGENVSGADAYRTYGAVAHEHVTKRGGRLITLNAVKQQLIGASQDWHQVAIMEYQNVAAFIDMISDPEYQKSLVHRNAGLETTEVFVTRPIING
jgi:uncharacterized protein (DUF1330 family)